MHIAYHCNSKVILSTLLVLSLLITLALYAARWSPVNTNYSIFSWSYRWTSNASAIFPLMVPMPLGKAHSRQMRYNFTTNRNEENIITTLPIIASTTTGDNRTSVQFPRPNALTTASSSIAVPVYSTLQPLTASTKGHRSRTEADVRFKGCGHLDSEFVVKAHEDIIRLAIERAGSRQHLGKSLFKQKLPDVQAPLGVHTLSGKNVSLPKICQEIKSNLPVPNVVHYMLYYSQPISAMTMLSILSAIRVMNASHVFVWYEVFPHGNYWNYILNHSKDIESRFYFVYSPAPKYAYQTPVNNVHHKSDFMRLNALLLFGGIYIDTDVFIVRDMQPLRRFNTTLGKENPGYLCNGVIVSAPASTFVALWHVAYQCLDDAQWAAHSVMLPAAMAAKWPQLIHVEENSLHRPNWQEAANQLMNQKSKFDWTIKNYVVHFWKQITRNSIPARLEEIVKLRSPLGKLSQWILKMQ